MGSHHRVGEQAWLTGMNTTATFAAFAGTLRSDRILFSMAPHAGGTWDRDICLAYRGFRPRRWSEVIGDLVGTEPGTRRPLERRAKRALAQVALNLHAVRRSVSRHVLVGPWPRKATHLSLPYLSEGVDWEAVSAEALEWSPVTSL